MGQGERREAVGENAWWRPHSRACTLHKQGRTGVLKGRVHFFLKSLSSAGDVERALCMIAESGGQFLLVVCKLGTRGCHWPILCKCRWSCMWPVLNCTRMLDWRRGSLMAILRYSANGAPSSSVWNLWYLGDSENRHFADALSCCLCAILRADLLLGRGEHNFLGRACAGLLRPFCWCASDVTSASSQLLMIHIRENVNYVPHAVVTRLLPRLAT
jgi:hypothetical protein